MFKRTLSLPLLLLLAGPVQAESPSSPPGPHPRLLVMPLQAAEAQKQWAKKTAKERATVLRRWFDLMMANQEDLATILTAEQGKPMAESRGEIAYGASFIEWFAEEAKRVYDETVPGHQRDKRITVLKQPIGVAASITPWNFPCAMITRKVGPALAAATSSIVAVLSVDRL